MLKPSLSSTNRELFHVYYRYITNYATFELGVNYKTNSIHNQGCQQLYSSFHLVDPIPASSIVGHTTAFTTVDHIDGRSYRWSIISMVDHITASTASTTWTVVAAPPAVKVSFRRGWKAEESLWGEQCGEPSPRKDLSLPLLDDVAQLADSACWATFRIWSVYARMYSTSGLHPCTRLYT
jgi:hypothetical protein